MVLFRALGWLLVVMTVAAAVQNGLTWWSEGVFRFLTLGDVWAHLEYGSLAAIQGPVTGSGAARGWAWGVLAMLRLPAVPVFLILGLFLLWIGQRSPEGRRGGGRASSSFAVGTRRPKRRRSRGLNP
jgi:hypothetical protein